MNSSTQSIPSPDPLSIPLSISNIPQNPSETLLEQLFSKQRVSALIYEELASDFDLGAFTSDEIRAIVSSTQWRNIPLVSAAASLCRGEVEQIAYWSELLLNLEDKFNKDEEFFQITFRNQYMIDSLIILDCQEEIDQTMYLPPMVSRPNMLHQNTDSARYNHKEDLILGHYLNFHEGNICLDVLNTQNNIPLYLDWDFIDSYEFDDSDELFSKQRDMVHQILGKRRFFLTNSVDKRGRAYTNGYHVNIQGNPEQRACISLRPE